MAGYYSPEKGIDQLVRLLKENFPPETKSREAGAKRPATERSEVETLGILLGIPNPEAVQISSVEVVNTASEEDYRAMLSRCDVLVQNGSKDSYFYRASGPIADAAACGTAVVAPDFPMIGKQAAGVGEVFQTLEKMPDVLRVAIEKVRAGGYDFSSYCAARSARALAKRLDDFCDEKG